MQYAPKLNATCCKATLYTADHLSLMLEVVQMCKERRIHMRTDLLACGAGGEQHRHPPESGRRGRAVPQEWHHSDRGHSLLPGRSPLVCRRLEDRLHLLRLPKGPQCTARSALKAGNIAAIATLLVICERSCYRQEQQHETCHV